MRKKIGSLLGNERLQILVLLAIPLMLSIALRMQTADLPMADEWAKNSVYSATKANIRADIDKQDPGLSDAQKNALVEQQFQQVLATYGDKINAQIKANSQALKDVYEDPQGRVYNLNIDPYYYLRWARNYLEHGYIGDEIRQGRNFDNHMIAPAGRYIDDAGVYPYALVFLYRIAHALSSGMTLEESSKYLPVILSALAVIPAFFMGRRISNNIGGFFTALIVASNVAMLSRTMFGDADNDSYSVFFPVTIVWLFVETLEAKTLRKKCVFAALTGTAVGVYSFAWAGWWYIFDFILATLGISFLYFIAAHRAELKGGLSGYASHPVIRGMLATGFFLVLFAGIFTSAFLSLGSFLSAPLSPFDFMKIKDASHTNLWPNVYTTVAELNPGSLDEVVGTMGGNNLFWASALGIALTLFIRNGYTKGAGYAGFLALWFGGIAYAHARNVFSINALVELAFAAVLMVAILLFRSKDHEKPELRYLILLSMWFAGTIYATTKGVRFNLLLVPAFAAGFGAAAGILYCYFSKSFSFKSGHRRIEVPKAVPRAFVLLLFVLLLNAPLTTAYNLPKSGFPLVNDAWYDALVDIKEKTPKNTILTSWWDYGHIFKYIADRPVTFDGASQNVPQAHWAGKLLLTSNEDEAVGILRMLDCGGNAAYDRLDSFVNDTPKSIGILDKVLLLDKAGARKALEGNGLSGGQADEVLQYTHCDAPPAVVIASEDMIGKAGVWAHFGSWDFDRADWWVTARKLDREAAISEISRSYGMPRDRAQQIVDEIKAVPNEDAGNSWIAPWPTYRSGLTACSNTGDSIKCDGIGLTVNSANMDATLSVQGGSAQPASLVYLTNNGVEEKKFSGRTVPLSAFIIPAQNGYYGMLADPSIVNSMFTRMFFMNGYGLKHFELLTQKQSAVGTQVYVWKVKWE